MNRHHLTNSQSLNPQKMNHQRLKALQIKKVNQILHHWVLTLLDLAGKLEHGRDSACMIKMDCNKFVLKSALSLDFDISLLLTLG